MNKYSTQPLSNISAKQAGRRNAYDRKGKRRGGNEAEHDVERTQPLAAMQTLSI